MTDADIRALKSLEARGLMYPEEVNAVFEPDYRMERNGEACDEWMETQADVDSIYGGAE